MATLSGSVTMIKLTVILFAITMFFSGYYANASEVPKDAAITVTHKGKVIGTFSRATHKVVRLGTGKTTVVTKTVVVTGEIKNCPIKKNRLQAKFGAGKDGLSTKYKNNAYEISEKTKPVFGISYSRKVGGDLNLGVSTHTNKTTTFDVGVDF